jgi:hypothetical protein
MTCPAQSWRIDLSSLSKKSTDVVQSMHRVVNWSPSNRNAKPDGVGAARSSAAPPTPPGHDRAKRGLGLTAASGWASARRAHA